MKHRFSLISIGRTLRPSRPVLLLFSTALLFGCGGGEKAPETVVTVQVTPAKRGPIEQTISAEAVVSPLEQAVITPKITSTIKKFYVQRGSHVKRGQPLADLENADLAAAAEKSKGEYEQAEAGYAMTMGASLPEQIQKAELDAAASKAAFEAQKKVYNARSQNEQAQKQLVDLQRLGKEQTVKSASGQLSAAKGNYLSAQAQVSYSQIRSPIDGVVTDRPLFEGELATANQPLLTVMNISKLVAKTHIAQDEAVELKVGDAAELNLEGVEDPIKGRVMLISPALDPGSTTIEVWVEAIKPGPALKPGMNVSVEAIAKSVKDALVVPASAVYKSPEAGDYVLLAGSDGKARLTKVKVGIRSKELAEIQSGLKEGDSVITAGGYALPDGTKIKIEAAPPAEGDAAKDSADKSEKTGAPTEKPSAKGKE